MTYPGTTPGFPVVTTAPQEGMTAEELLHLQVGDIIRSRSSGQAYVITANYRDRIIAVRTVDVTNASEWVLARGERDGCQVGDGVLDPEGGRCAKLRS